MQRPWMRTILSVIMTLLFAYFVIPLSLISITLSYFLRKKLQQSIDRYGRDNIVKLVLQGNLKGLATLLFQREKSKREISSR
ncbi:MAG: hypothetical protein ACTSRS_18115 [Candidatus Helarchaeota archaeon]